MNFKVDMIEVLISYGVIVVLAVLGIVWDLKTRLLVTSLDGIFLLLICLSMAGTFALMLLATAISSGLVKPIKFSRAGATESKADAPSAAGSSGAADSGAKAEGK